MKSQERHRLEQNVLADWIAQTLEQIKPYLTPILVGILVVVLVFGGWSLWSSQASRSSGAAWSELYAAFAARSAEKLEEVAEAHPRTDVAHWGLILAGDERLARGCQSLFMDRTAATQELNKAKDAYETVVKQSRESRLRERALFGLGRTYEALAGSRQSEGAPATAENLKSALDAYQKLLENETWRAGPYGELAKERVAALQSPDVKVFYDKFAAFERKSPVANEPGIPGQRPEFDLKGLDENLPKLKVKEPGSVPTVTPEGTKPEGTKPEGAKAEGAKAEPPKPAAAPAKTDAKPETPKPAPQPPKVEAKPETPKPAAAPAKVEAKPEPPKTEPAKPAAPKAEPVDPPKVEKPKTEPAKEKPAPAKS